MDTKMVIKTINRDIKIITINEKVYKKFILLVMYSLYLMIYKDTSRLVKKDRDIPIKKKRELYKKDIFLSEVNINRDNNITFYNLLNNLPPKKQSISTHKNTKQKIT